MADAFTVNYNLIKPEEGASLNTWGGKLNVNMDTLDEALEAIQAQLDSAFNPLTGMLAVFARSTPPSGWLVADGSAVSRTEYARLFDVIGTTYGAGNGATTFNLPDIRGEFLRVLDQGRGVDPGRVLGSVQQSQNLEHNHSASTGSAGAHNHSASTASAGSHSHTGSADSDGAHTHGGTTGSAGSHSHTGAANSAGAHTHTHTRFQHTRDSAGGAGGGFCRYSTTGTTSSAGAHTHSLSINNNGAHTHTFTTASGGAHGHSLNINSNGAHTHSVTVQDAGSHSHSVSVANSGGSEARPRNSAWLGCIKF